MILDTDFLISLRAAEDGAIALAAELEADNVPTRLPTIVVQELFAGVGAGADRVENARDFEALVANTPVVPLDGHIARRAGVLEGRHLASDERPTLGPGDAIVAATALVHDESVVTNDEDFAAVDGLRVTPY